MHGEDVWAGHAPQQLTFQDEALAQIGIEGVVLGQDLDGHVAVEAAVVGPVDGGEGSGADDATSAVPADPLGRRAHRTDPAR